jgi:hypothetical protein
VNPGVNVNRGSYTNSGVSRAVRWWAMRKRLPYLGFPYKREYLRQQLRGAVAGTVSGDSDVKDVSVSGCTVKGVRLAGAFGPAVWRRSHFRRQCVISGLEVDTILNESTGLRRIRKRRQLRTAAFAGNIAELGKRRVRVSVSSCRCAP